MLCCCLAGRRRWIGGVTRLDPRGPCVHQGATNVAASVRAIDEDEISDQAVVAASGRMNGHVMVQHQAQNYDADLRTKRLVQLGRLHTVQPDMHALARGFDRPGVAAVARRDQRIERAGRLRVFGRSLWVVRVPT